MTALVEKVYELEAIAQTLKNDYLRALADFDNYRRRIERDIEVKKREGLESLICDLLPVLDNFERALSSGSSSVEGLKKGVEMIYRQLVGVLESYGLKGYSCSGEEFDPRRAEAVGFIDCCNQSDDNRVLEELCRGYEIGGRVVRPARVKVGRFAQEQQGLETDRARAENGESKAESK